MNTAEGARFELAEALLLLRFSRPVHSTALSPFRYVQDMPAHPTALSSFQIILTHKHFNIQDLYVLINLVLIISVYPRAVYKSNVNKCRLKHTNSSVNKVALFIQIDKNLRGARAGKEFLEVRRALDKYPMGVYTVMVSKSYRTYEEKYSSPAPKYY